MSKQRIAPLVLLGLAVCLTLKSSGSTLAPVRPIWTEIKWGFPVDQWGGGKAFHCDAVACGTEVDVFVRPKIGFCKCTSGVDDDAELERVADFDLFGDQHSALSPGHPISVRWMTGRSRAYSFPRSFGQRKLILTIAFNDRCDAIVATAIASHNSLEEIETVVLGLLSGDQVIRWIEQTLGL